MSEIKIKVCRVEGLPGFAAYLAGTLSESGATTVHLEPNQALVLLNVSAVFDDTAVVYENGKPIDPRTLDERKRQMIEHLMHEFGHVLEEFFDTEFDEGWIESVTESYSNRPSRLAERGEK